jgi:hypothetical protein
MHSRPTRIDRVTIQVAHSWEIFDLNQSSACLPRKQNCVHASDQTTTEPATPLMKSRRRIAFLKAQDHANCGDDYSRDLRLAKWGSEVSLHGNNPVPLMSALGQKRT